MLTFVINLDRDTARLERIEALLAARAVPFTRVQAVDGRSLSQADIEKISVYPTAVSVRLQPGEIACYLSHIRAWRMLLESDEERAAIFEDDIDISADAAEILAGLSDWMPDDVDIVKLETSLKPVEVAPDVETTICDRNIRRLAGCHIGTAGYIISRRGAARMLAESERLKMAVDTMLFDPRGGVAQTLSLFQLSPALCVQARLQKTSEPAIESNIARRASHKTYGATFGEQLANRARDRWAYAARRLRNLAGGARASVVDFKP